MVCLLDSGSGGCNIEIFVILLLYNLSLVLKKVSFHFTLKYSLNRNQELFKKSSLAETACLKNDIKSLTLPK